MRSKKIVIFGLVSAGIIIAASVATWQFFFNYPRYDLGAKDELISKLSEYLSREPDNAVRLVNETHSVLQGDQEIYSYDLVAAHDSKAHGKLIIGTYYQENKVWKINVKWEHRGDPNLLNASELIVSAITDNAIPEWQTDDGRPNRNVQMLNWIHANATQYPVVKHFSQDRTLSLTAGQDRFSLSVAIIKAKFL